MLRGNVTGNVTGICTVPNANGLVVNTTPLGDYSTFESAFNTAIALMSDIFAQIGSKLGSKIKELQAQIDSGPARR